jgi:hypothetical protein
MDLPERHLKGQKYLAALMASEPHRVMVLPDGSLALKPQPRRAPSRCNAAVLARKRHPKPSQCEDCHCHTTKLHAHHVIPYATLKAQGRQHDPEAHILTWICEACHLAHHAGEPVAALMARNILT